MGYINLIKDFKDESFVPEKFKPLSFATREEALASLKKIANTLYENAEILKKYNISTIFFGVDGNARIPEVEADFVSGEQKVLVAICASVLATEKPEMLSPEIQEDLGRLWGGDSYDRK